MVQKFGFVAEVMIAFHQESKCPLLKTVHPNQQQYQRIFIFGKNGLCPFLP